MSVYCLLNHDKFKVNYSKFYNPLLLIDVKKYQMKCNLTNSFLFFIENPRTNIELVSGFFEFYFKTIPQDHTLGQVISKSLSVSKIISIRLPYLRCVIDSSIRLLILIIFSIRAGCNEVGVRRRGLL
jgi:hypothetical protein